MVRKARLPLIILITITTWVEMCLRRGTPCRQWASRELPWPPLPLARHPMAALLHIRRNPWWAPHQSSTRDPRSERKGCKVALCREGDTLNSPRQNMCWLGWMKLFKEEKYTWLFLAVIVCGRLIHQVYAHDLLIYPCIYYNTCHH